MENVDNMLEKLIRMTHPPDDLPARHVYTYACHETEKELCLLELKELLGASPGQEEGWLFADRTVDPDRSPFLTARIDLVLTGSTLDVIAAQAEHLTLLKPFFKVVCLKAGNFPDYDEQRRLERLVGARIRGKAEMKEPDTVLGLMAAGGQWLLGVVIKPVREWRNRIEKPYNYSTGLSVKIARALVNIAAPNSKNLSLLDPCCGMGNVLIEALSMDMAAEGCDINPLAVQGARTNLKHFGYPDGLVRLGDINDLTGAYDSAVLDMPYNLCSVLPPEDRLRMLASLRRLATRAVIVSTEPVEDDLPLAGWSVLGYARASKGRFVRHIWLCE